MKYSNVSGAWLKVDDSLDGKKVKIVNECVQVESRFKDEEGNPKTENQVKVRVQGADEAVNARLNWTTVYGLIDAFGEESKNWIGHILTAKVKDATTGQSLYLIPEGFELVRNEEKRWAIRRVGGPATEEEAIDPPADDEPAIQYPEEINPEDIPF